MDIEKFPTDPKYVKLDKGDSDEHINVENSVTTDPISVEVMTVYVMSFLSLKMNTARKKQVMMISMWNPSK